MKKTEILDKISNILAFGWSQKDEACMNAGILYYIATQNNGFIISNSSISKWYNIVGTPNFSPDYNYVGKLAFCSLIVDAKGDSKASDEAKNIVLRFPQTSDLCSEFFMNTPESNDINITGVLNTTDE